ncbi:MAG TPA: hypothetical protein VHO23_02830 [Candidatus Paceibacterota bacterium]|nr:hypothetical protein [Candidatus Paceibacterota bacterium]
MQREDETTLRTCFECGHMVPRGYACNTAVCPHLSANLTHGSEEPIAALDSGDPDTFVHA